MSEEKSETGDLVWEPAAHRKGVLIGVTIYTLFCLVLFLSAFMIAFGNETSWSGWALHTIDLFFIVANPIWGIPASLVLGALVIEKT
jgi:hypothetical protein